MDFKTKVNPIQEGKVRSQNSPGVKWALAGLAGFLCFLAIPPRDQFWAGWIAFVPLLWAQRDVSAKKAFALGWVTGTLSNLGAFYWVYELMVTHSAMPAIGAVLATLFMGVQQGLREAIWLGLARRFQGGPWAQLLVFPTIYVAAEFLYPTVFPLHLSNSQHVFLWTHQLMDLAGPAGLSWVMMLFNIGLFQLLAQRKPTPQVGLALGLLVLTLVYGKVRVGQLEQMMADSPKLRVGMVENNVGIGQADFKTAMRQIDLARELANREQPDLIVFPETAVKTPPPTHLRKGQEPANGVPQRFYPLDMVSCAQDEQFSVQRGYRVPVLFGCTAIDPEREGPVPGRPALFNAAFMLDAEGNVLGTALKNKLLLFGEFVPGARYFPSIYTKILTQASALYPGTEPALITMDGRGIGVSICYEDILPNFSYELLQKEPQLLVNLTNDGWFGKTAEPAAHLALAKARAVEGRLYLVRSTCTGISSFIDPLGRSTQETDLESPETLVTEVAWMPGGTVFGAGGYYFAWLTVLISLIWIVWQRRRDGLPELP